MRTALVGAAAALLASGAPASAQSVERCVEARVGGEVAYDCLNDAWARLAERSHGPITLGTLGATSAAPAIGTFNRTATAERMGDAFGHSVVSQRPAPPVFVNPLVAGRPAR